MTAYPRRLQKVFGSGLTPAGNVAVWGSLVNAALAYSADPLVLQGGTASGAFENGFNGEVVGNRSPSLEEMNGLMLEITQQLAYVLQAGTPEWNADTTYWANQICRGTETNVLYYSVTNNNTNNAVTDTNNWLPLANSLKGPPMCAAWAVFDGINVVGPNARLINAFNVTSVTKNAAGNYTLNFTTNLPSANYAIGGSCGSEDGQAYGAGDDGVVVGNVTGQGNAVRSVSACRVFTINPTNKALVSAGCVSVFIFGS